MKLLPVPPLAETLERYLAWVKPHLSESEFKETEAIVKDFHESDGPRIQKRLEAFAAEKSESSWLIDFWHQSYLCGRAPVSIGSNVSLELIFDDLKEIDSGESRASQLNRVAHFIAAEAQVHADYLSGAYHESVSPRGDQLCFQQFAILKGAARISQKGCDSYYFNEDSNLARDIAVIWKNQTYMLPILNEKGEVYSADAIKVALEEICRHDVAMAPYFHTLTYAGSDQAREILDQLLTVPNNNSAFERINGALFGITLINDDHNYLESVFEATFGENFWAYQPLSYLYNLKTGQIQHHVEHAYEDAGMLVDIHLKAKANLEAGLQGVNGNISAEKIGWELTPSTKTALKNVSESYRQHASEYEQCSLDFPFVPDTEYIRFSRDAAIQFSMQYAQLKTLGQVNNVYEAVDMREFQSGRTECVRPVSVESVEFVHRLQEESDEEILKTSFTKAETEHRERIKACKSGHGVNRHLIGLEFIADELNLAPAIFKDRGYQKITTDFLSTTTLGDNGVVRDVGFVPSVEDGYAIYYQGYRSGVRFLLTYKKSKADEAKRFMKALEEGVYKIFSLVEA